VICLAPRALRKIVRPRRLADTCARPLNFCVMRLPKDQRTWAAMSFIWTPVLCIGILLIDASYGFGLKDLWISGADSRALAIALVAMPCIAVSLSALLFSRVRLSRQNRLLLVLFCSVVALANLLYSEMVLIAWLFPLWFLIRFYRDAGA
jgi:hypothetical protein